MEESVGMQSIVRWALFSFLVASGIFPAQHFQSVQAQSVDSPCPKGLSRVFKENDRKETVCTNAPSVSIGADGTCPTGFYHTAIAHPPYNDLCISRTPPNRTLTEIQKRIEFARLQQIDEKQLEPGKDIRITAVGQESRTFRMQMRFVNNQYLNELFHSGIGYAESLWAHGFRLTVVTDGTNYWAAPLNQSGYGEVTGPYLTDPTLEDVLIKLRPPVGATKYRGLYIGEPLRGIDLREHDCYYDADKALSAILQKGHSSPCLLISADGRTIARFVVFEAEPYPEVSAGLIAKYGTPIPGKYSLLDGVMEREWTLWETPDGTYIAAKPNAGRNIQGKIGPWIYYTDITVLKREPHFLPGVPLGGWETR